MAKDLLVVMLVYIQLLLLRTIPDELKNNSSIALPLTCPVLVSSFLVMMAIVIVHISVKRNVYNDLFWGLCFICFHIVYFHLNNFSL
jgi:hypothetical protein